MYLIYRFHVNGHELKLLGILYIRIKRIQRAIIQTCNLIRTKKLFQNFDKTTWSS